MQKILVKVIHFVLSNPYLTDVLNFNVLTRSLYRY